MKKKYIAKVNTDKYHLKNVHRFVIHYGEIIQLDERGKYSVNGNTFYYDHNMNFHRDGGPAIIYSHGATIWYQHGVCHRDDGGPADSYKNFSHYWYKNGLLHREDGPAIIDNFMDKNYWYFNNEKINCSSQEEFKKLLKLKSFW